MEERIFEKVAKKERDQSKEKILVYMQYFD